MDIVKKIHALKFTEYEDAYLNSIVIEDQELKNIGRLVPVGAWLLNSENDIENISSWRKKTMKMFLTQFDSTAEKTKIYIDKLCLQRDDRILFMILDADDRKIGHVGLVNINNNSVELDNLMRGVNGGDPRLIYFAELALLNWAFKKLNVRKSDVLVVSYNWLVKSLHEDVGFLDVQYIPLLKLEKDGVVYHELLNSKSKDSNVSYSCIKMELNRDVFNKKFKWLSELNV